MEQKLEQTRRGFLRSPPNKGRFGKKAVRFLAPCSFTLHGRGAASLINLDKRGRVLGAARTWPTRTADSSRHHQRRETITKNGNKTIPKVQRFSKSDFPVNF
jgi:hypothetical protein